MEICQQSKELHLLLERMSRKKRKVKQKRKKKDELISPKQRIEEEMTFREELERKLSSIRKKE
ncbi:MAG: hypothetical protein ACTSVU_04690 [Promethearchaeota archaeon]